MNDAIQQARDLAWTGDAVLALFAREWILRQPDIPKGRREATFQELTGNRALNAMGQPTRIEAQIGRIYREQGLAEAFAWIEKELLPTLERQRRNRDQR